MKKVLMMFKTDAVKFEMVRVTDAKQSFYRLRIERETRWDSIPYETQAKARDAFIKAVYNEANRI